MQRVTECHGLCSSGPNVTQPLLYLEDAPASSAQTHRWNPGLAESKGEPYKKWLWPTKLSHSLQCLTWSYLIGLAGFPFINKISVGKRLLCGDPTKSGQWDFNHQQIWPLLLLKAEIQSPKCWFGVRDFACPGGVHSWTLSWRKPHFVGSSSPKFLHSLQFIFN